MADRMDTKGCAALAEWTRGRTIYRHGVSVFGHLSWTPAGVTGKSNIPRLSSREFVPGMPRIGVRDRAGQGVVFALLGPGNPPILTLSTLQALLA